MIKYYIKHQVGAPKNSKEGHFLYYKDTTISKRERHPSFVDIDKVLIENDNPTKFSVEINNERFYPISKENPVDYEGRVYEVSISDDGIDSYIKLPREQAKATHEKGADLSRNTKNGEVWYRTATMGYHIDKILQRRAEQRDDRRNKGPRSI